MRSIYLVLSAAVFLLDQLTKWAVVSRFSSDTIVTVIPGFFSLVRVENRGIAFGWLSQVSSGVAFTLILMLSAVALAVVSFLLYKTPPAARRSSIALALILGGAAGNFLDRIVRGSVIDFLDFYVHGYHWPAFNVADSAIVCGAALLLLDLFFARHPNPVATEK